MKSKFLIRMILIGLMFAEGTVLALGQDTRGSVVFDTQVLLADGSSKAAEDVEVGISVWVWTAEGKAGTAKVTAVRRQNADSYIRLKAADREIQATGSFRIALAGGRLVRLDTVKLGDKVWITGPKGPLEATVSSVRLYPATLVAYDLTVEGHLPFSAGGLVVGD